VSSKRKSDVVERCPAVGCGACGIPLRRDARIMSARWLGRRGRILLLVALLVAWAIVLLATQGPGAASGSAAPGASAAVPVAPASSPPTPAAGPPASN